MTWCTSTTVFLSNYLSTKEMGVTLSSVCVCSTVNGSCLCLTAASHPPAACHAALGRRKPRRPPHWCERGPRFHPRPPATHPRSGCPASSFAGAATRRRGSSPGLHAVSPDRGQAVGCERRPPPPPPSPPSRPARARSLLFLPSNAPAVSLRPPPSRLQGPDAKRQAGAERVPARRRRLLRSVVAAVAAAAASAAAASAAAGVVAVAVGWPPWRGGPSC